MIDYYLSLLASGEHVAGFERAIRATVTPEDVVVDLGCGVGTYAIFAARAGARRVFAVDASPAIAVAGQMARRNNVDIEFFAGHSDDVELPEKATVLIFEDYSTDLLSGSAGAALESVRERWMADDHRVIPERVSLHACPISSKEVRDLVNPFRGDEQPRFGLDCSALLELSRDSDLYPGRLEDSVLLGDADVFLEQSTASLLPEAQQFSGEIAITGSGNMDGLCIWHDLTLSPENTYSNRPVASTTWGQLVLPSPQPWPVTPHDRLRYQITFHSFHGSGLWKWSFQLVAASGQALRECSGDSFAGTPMHRFVLDDPVELTSEAAIDARVLALADGDRTITDIANALQDQLQLPDLAAALALVHRSLADRRKPR